MATRDVSEAAAVGPGDVREVVVADVRRKDDADPLAAVLLFGENLVGRIELNVPVSAEVHADPFTRFCFSEVTSVRVAGSLRKDREPPGWREEPSFYTTADRIVTSLAGRHRLDTPKRCTDDVILADLLDLREGASAMGADGLNGALGTREVCQAAVMADSTMRTSVGVP